jgi:hypothetical protein
MAGGNASLNEIMTTTLRKWLERKFIDNVFKARVLSWTLMNGDNIRKVDGGESLLVPVLEGTNGTVMTYSNDEELRILRQKGLTGAVFNWAQASASITITGIEEAKNAGEARMISLLEAKTEQAQESFKGFYNKVFFGKAADTLNKSAMDPTVAWNGLGDFMPATTLTVGGLTGTPTDETITGYDTATVPGTSSGNIGADYPAADPGHGVRPGGFWIPAAGTVGAPTTGSAGDYDMTAGKKAMRNMYNTVSIGDDQPNLILTTQLLFEAYEDSLVDQIRYTNTQMGDAGFQNLMFKGCPITYDADQVAHLMDFLNTRYLRLVGHSDTWFRNTPFIRPNNRDARTAQILCYGQLTISKRSAQGRLTFTPKAP